MLSNLTQRAIQRKRLSHSGGIGFAPKIGQDAAAMSKTVNRPPPAKFRPTHLRAWRKYRGMTIVELGEKIGMTNSNLSMLENGKRGYTQGTLEKLAEALETDVNSLLSRDPGEAESIWSVWQRADRQQREQILAVANVVVKKPD